VRQAEAGGANVADHCKEHAAVVEGKARCGGERAHPERDPQAQRQAEEHDVAEPRAAKRPQAFDEAFADYRRGRTPGLTRGVPRQSLGHVLVIGRGQRISIRTRPYGGEGTDKRSLSKVSAYSASSGSETT
jgi:hypothetical protein